MSCCRVEPMAEMIKLDVRPKRKMMKECSLHRMSKRKGAGNRERSTSGVHLFQKGN